MSRTLDGVAALADSIRELPGIARRIPQSPTLVVALAAGAFRRRHPAVAVIKYSALALCIRDRFGVDPKWPWLVVLAARSAAAAALGIAVDLGNNPVALRGGVRERGLSHGVNLELASEAVSKIGMPIIGIGIDAVGLLLIVGALDQANVAMR